MLDAALRTDRYEVTMIDAAPEFGASGPGGVRIDSGDANLNPALPRIEAWFAKGSHEAPYSGFEGRSTTSEETLDQYLRRRSVNAIDVVGPATDLLRGGHRSISVGVGVPGTCAYGSDRRSGYGAVDTASGERTLVELASEGASVGSAAMISL